MKKVLLALAIATFGASVAHSQAMTSEQQQLDRRVTTTLIEHQIKLGADACYSETQMILHGKQAKDNGVTTEQLAKASGIKSGSPFYALLELGRSIDGPLDAKIKDHFDECIKKIKVTVE